MAVQRVLPTAPRAGVIVLLAGGPGQPALPFFEALLAPLARLPALRAYELVAFDQRGTGQSGALRCPEATESQTGTSFFAACGRALGASRGDYTSQESVEDVDALRQALGGAPLSLLADSYGARVAAMYAREHPEGVARMVLDSPVPLAGTDALYSQRERALRRVLDEGICGEGACRSFSTDVDADLTRLVGSLRQHPLHTRIYNGSGRLQKAIVTEAGVYSMISLLDLSKGLSELAPAAISAAAKGNGAQLARLTGGLTGPSATGSLGQADAATASSLLNPPNASPVLGDASANTSFSTAVFAATYCVENSLPWSSDSLPAGRAATVRNWLASLPAATTAPFALSTVASGPPIALCTGWPATPPAPPTPSGVSGTPTLILSGNDDLREPYEQDLTVASSYSQAQLLRIPQTGHSTLGTDPTGCAQRAMIAFLTTGQAPSACPASKESQAQPMPSASLSQVRPARSRSRLAGEGAAAAIITLADTFAQPAASGGGLRGGSWALHGTRVVFRKTVDVPGVALSGAIRVQGLPAGRLTVTGRVHGALTLRGHALSGRLNGARVSARLSY